MAAGSIEWRCVAHRIHKHPVCAKNGAKEYRARWRDAEGNSRRSRWLDRKYDAERQLATVQADLHRGTYVDVNNPVTVVEYARQWAAARPLRSRSQQTYEALIRNHLQTTPLGARPLVKVRPSEIQAWATGRARTLGPFTLRIHVGVLRSIFGAALLDGVIAKNPVLPKRQLQLPKDERTPVVPLTVDQVRALAAAMPDRYRAMVVTQAGLGLRIGELLALRVEDVDFLRRTVRVEGQLELSTLKWVPPKTPKSRRAIPLPRVVAETLAEYIGAFPPAADGTIFTMPSRSQRRTTASGTRIHHTRYGRWIIQAAQKAGLPATTSHDLRHHYASVLVHAGESVHAVAERLGHTDPTLVLKVYGHIMPNQEDRTRQAVDAAWTATGHGQETETGS